MRVITAPDRSKFSGSDISVFLAGGISMCPDWQSKVIDILSKMPDTDALTLYNPRRKSFSVNDSLMTYIQIGWEFLNLEHCDIFSMYFCNSESVQPICFYELGRNMLYKEIQHGPYISDHVIVSVEDGFKRAQDVTTQISFAFPGLKNKILNLDATPESHAKVIYELYRKELSKL